MFLQALISNIVSNLRGSHKVTNAPFVLPNYHGNATVSSVFADNCHVLSWTLLVNYNIFQLMEPDLPDFVVRFLSRIPIRCPQSDPGKYLGSLILHRLAFDPLFI